MRCERQELPTFSYNDSEVSSGMYNILIPPLILVISICGVGHLVVPIPLQSTLSICGVGLVLSIS